MKVDEKLILYLEELSRLELSETEKQKLTGDLTEILNYMAKLNELDTSDIDDADENGVNTPFRDDIVLPSFERGLILQNAPNHNDETFVAPKTLENDE